MTNPDTPSAAEALTAAWQIVKSPCSPAETARAEVLLGIAVELRQAADMRASLARRRELDARVPLARGGILPKSAAATFVGEPSFAAQRVPSAEPTHEGETAAERTQRLVVEAPIDMGAWAASLAAAETQVVRDDPGTTQRLPVVWSVGDKADCRHCHTPIELAEAEVTGPYAGDYAGASMWRHKYTGQVTCVEAVTAGRIEESGELRPVETALAHTFAEPAPRG